MSSNTLQLSSDRWDAVDMSDELKLQALQGLESGRVLFLPHLPFVLDSHEQSFLTPNCLLPKRKNVSFNASQSKLDGTQLQGQLREGLQVMMQRYADQSLRLIQHLLPQYSPQLQRARTSYRPAEIDKRKISPHKDDTRLHVDAFPSSPTQGKRILRVFTNINPKDQARHWRIGEEFSKVAMRFIPRIKPPKPLSAFALRVLKITKTYRTLYDHYMLQMHNTMKCDAAYQASVPYESFAFPPGSTWIVFTDQVSHAAMSGQYLFEQTFHLPVNSLLNPKTSPLRVLENSLQRQLV